MAGRQCYTRPTCRSWPLKQGSMEDTSQLKGDLEQKIYHLATRDGPEAHEERMGCPCEDPRGG